MNQLCNRDWNWFNFLGKSFFRYFLGKERAEWSFLELRKTRRIKFMGFFFLQIAVFKWWTQNSQNIEQNMKCLKEREKDTNKQINKQRWIITDSQLVAAWHLLVTWGNCSSTPPPGGAVVHLLNRSRVTSKCNCCHFTADESDLLCFRFGPIPTELNETEWYLVE